MSILFSKSRSLRESWHRELLSHDLAGQLAAGKLAAFPDSIIQITSAYLDRKKLLPRTTECEACLSELMEEHVFKRNGSPHLAFLACLRYYSRTTALVQLKGMRNGVTANLSLRTSIWPETSYTKYLHCLILTNKIIPSYVLDAEKSVAEMLLAIRNGFADPLLVFRRIVRELADIPSSEVLPTAYINRLLHFCNIRKSYEANLETLQAQYRWAELHRFVSWVSEIGQPHQCPLAHDVMQGQIPFLNAWLTWRPDPRFLILEPSKFTPEQLAKLRPILALEGPDLTDGSRHGTLKEAKSRALQATSISPPEPHLAVYLQSLLASAVNLDAQLRPAAINMLIGLCIDRLATEESLALASAVLRTRSSKCYSLALTAVACTAPAATMTSRLDAFVRVLPALNTNQDMWKLFSDKVVGAIEPTMKTAQDVYREQVAARLGDSFGYSIQAYGNAIRRATWLHDHLRPEFLASIGRFPPDNVLGGIIGRAQSAPSLPTTTEEAMRRYLLATLCGVGGTDEQIAEDKAVVDADLEFWITHPEIERNRVMMAIRNLFSPESPENPDFLRTFRHQIPHEDLVLLRDLLPLIERNTNISCGELVRVVTRRMLLHMGIHDVWISLALFMLLQRAENVLEWACDEPFESLLVWSSDVQQLAVRKPELAVLERIGLTERRLEWLALLEGSYAHAVKYLDLLQQRDNRGLTSLKWLYLEETPGVTTLLDVIMNNEDLGYDKEWILCFYDGTVASLASICVFLQASQACGPYGRIAIHTMLKRFREKESPADWPDGAVQAYAMAWIWSGKLTAADDSAIRHLLAVFGLKPALNMRGVAVLRARMLREYDAAMERARQLERLRAQLSRADPKRAAALVARLGLKEVQPYVDAAVPPQLSDVIESLGGGVYELCFPLTHLDEVDLKLRGISRALSVLSVRVSLAGTDSTQHGFCVHMLPHSYLLGQQGDYRNQGAHHEICSSQSGPPTSRLCGATLHMFTHALVQRLFRLFQAAVADEEPVRLQVVHDAVADTIRRPGAECTACGDALANLWRPTICTKLACYQEQQRLSLYVRCQSLLVDPAVLDFLLCCLYSAATDIIDARTSSTLQLLTKDCPYGRYELREVIDSFPPLPASGAGGPWQLLKTIRAFEEEDSRTIAARRERLLAWMSKWFRGCLLSAPPGKRLAIMSDVEQFVLFNSTPECEEAFASRMQQQAAAGASSAPAAADLGSKVVFHGSQAGRMWRVLTEGLRNMSNTAYMRNGAVSGPGIYLADEPATSFHYSGSLCHSWRNSAFHNRKVLLGCELADAGLEPPVPGRKPPPVGTHIVTDESRVLVRYVFLCPENYRTPPAHHVRPAMQTTFATLRAGPG